MVRFLILTGEKRKFLTRILCLSGLEINFLIRKTSILLGWMQPVYFEVIAGSQGSNNTFY